MHRLKVAKYGDGRPARIGMACSDELESALRTIANHLGVNISQLIESISRDWVSSLNNKQDSRLTNELVALCEMARDMDADGKRSITERFKFTKYLWAIFKEWMDDCLESIFHKRKTA